MSKCLLVPYIGHWCQLKNAWWRSEFIVITCWSMNDGLLVDHGGLKGSSIAGKPTCPGGDSQSLPCPHCSYTTWRQINRLPGYLLQQEDTVESIVNLVLGTSWDLEVVYFLSLVNFVLMSLPPNWYVSIGRNFYTTIASGCVLPVSVKGKARDDAYVLFISPHNSTRVKVMLIIELTCQVILMSHCLRLRHTWFVFYTCMTMRAAICNARSLRTHLGEATAQTHWGVECLTDIGHLFLALWQSKAVLLHVAIHDWGGFE